MRSAALAALVAIVLAVTAIASPALTALITASGWKVTLPRVYDRVFEILLVPALVLAWRRLDLGGPAAIGLRRRAWPRELAYGLVVGLLGLGVGLLVGWLGGAIVPGLRYPFGKTLRKAGLGLLAAILIGVGEETLFRGVLLRRLRLDFGRVAGVVVTTAIYAVVHAIRTGGAKHLTGPLAGIERTAALFAPVADPVTWPGVAGLAGLGLLLAWARLRSGSLWIPIGLHAGWVAVFRVGRLFFGVRKSSLWLVGPGWPPLIGGIAGAVALAATAWLARRTLHRAVIRRG